MLIVDNVRAVRSFPSWFSGAQSNPRLVTGDVVKPAGISPFRLVCGCSLFDAANASFFLPRWASIKSGVEPSDIMMESSCLEIGLRSAGSGRESGAEGVEER